MNAREREIQKAETVERLEKKVDDLTNIVEMILQLVGEKK